MTTLTTFEHATLSAQDFPNPHDFDWLIEQNFPCFTIERNRHTWQLKVRYYLGVIGLPSGQQLEILPKISHKISQSSDVKKTRHWVQTMLAEIWHTLPNTPLPSLANQHILPHINTELPLSTWLYQHFLHLLNQYQPNQHYQNTQQNQTFLQGKLLIKEQLQHNSHQAHKFFSQYDKFSPTTAINRIIKTALQLFAKPFLFKQSPFINAQFWQTIEPLQPSQYAHFFAQSLTELNQFSHTQHKLTEPLLIFCQWLLQLQQPLPSFDAHQVGLTLLINMNTAFEKWVSFRMVQKFSADFAVTLQRSQPLVVADNGEALLTIKPDIVLHNTEMTIVADVKWKSIRRVKDIGLADMYQLLTYANEFGAGQAWLIVPTVDDTMPKQRIILTQPTACQFWLVPFCLTNCHF